MTAPSMLQLPGMLVAGTNDSDPHHKVGNDHVDEAPAA